MPRERERDGGSNPHTEIYRERHRDRGMQRETDVRPREIPRGRDRELESERELGSKRGRERERLIQSWTQKVGQREGREGERRKKAEGGSGQERAEVGTGLWRVWRMRGLTQEELGWGNPHPNPCLPQVWPPTLDPNGEVSRAAPGVRSWQNLAPAKRLGQGVSGTVCWGEGRSGRSLGLRGRPRPPLPKPGGSTEHWPGCTGWGW